MSKSPQRTRSTAKRRVLVKTPAKAKRPKAEAENYGAYMQESFKKRFKMRVRKAKKR
jgi:hypothetical protein